MMLTPKAPIRTTLTDRIPRARFVIDRLRRSAFATVTVAAVLLAALAVLPRPASAANPIDGGNPTTDRAGGPDSEDDFTILDRNNPISGDGVLTSWTIFAKVRTGDLVSQNQVKLKIYRESGGVFTVVGESAFVLPDLTLGEQTFALAAPIPVLAGDLVGMRVDAQGVVPFSVADGGTPFADGDLTRVTLFNIDAADAATGEVETFDSSGDRMYSIHVDGTDFELTLDPASDANIIGDSHTVTASVGAAAPGVTVHFEVTAGPNAGDTGTADTDETGAAAFTYPGDGGAGTDEIVAWLDRNGDGLLDENEPSATATKLWVSDAVSAVSLSPATDSNPVGADHKITATVTPRIAGVTVRFDVSSGPNAGDAGSGITATNGKTSFTYTGDGGTGSDLILAWADLDEDGEIDANEPKAVAVKEWVSGETVTTLSLSPTTDSNPLGTPHTVTATVSPQVEGVVVRFEVSAGPNSGDNGTDATDANGQATFTYTGDGGAGGDLILAWADLNDDSVVDANEPKAVALKEWVGDGAVTAVSLSPVTDSNPLGASHTVTATVSPQIAGVVVHFEVTAGPNASDTGSDVTDANGEATFTYTGDGGPGTDLIVAWADLDSNGVHDADEPTSAALKEWVPADAVTAIALAPATDSNPLGTPHTVTATVSPQIAGVVVRFSVSAGPNAGDTGSDTTDVNGQATFTYTGDGGLGSDLVVAWADLDNNGVQDADEPTSAALKEWVPAETVTAIALAPTTDSNPLGTSHTVTATVSPQIAGVVVRFSVSAGPNAGDTGTATTDVNGQATFTYTGDGGVGSDLILAWADLNNDGALDVDEPKAIAAKQWELIAGDIVTSVALAPVSDSNPVGANHTVTAMVSPKIEGVLVRFEVTAGPNSGDTGSDVTNSQGKATFTYTGDGGVGSDLILAWVDLDSDGEVDASEPTAIAVKQWVSDGVGVPDGSVQEICESATFSQYPALPVLCSLLDRLPPKAREAIERVILRRDEFDKFELKIESKHDKFKLKLEAKGGGEDLKIEYEEKDGEQSKLKIKEKPGRGRGHGHDDDHDDDDDDDHDDDDDDDDD